MPAQYSDENASDPDLYVRLLQERYGPLPKLLAELRSRETSIRAKPEEPPAPDPDAHKHYLELAEAIALADRPPKGTAA